MEGREGGGSGVKHGRESSKVVPAKSAALWEFLNERMCGFNS